MLGFKAARNSCTPPLAAQHTQLPHLHVLDAGPLLRQLISQRLIPLVGVRALRGRRLRLLLRARKWRGGEGGEGVARGREGQLRPGCQHAGAGPRGSGQHQPTQPSDLPEPPCHPAAQAAPTCALTAISALRWAALLHTPIS